MKKWMITVVDLLLLLFALLVIGVVVAHARYATEPGSGPALVLSTPGVWATIPAWGQPTEMPRTVVAPYPTPTPKPTGRPTGTPPYQNPPPPTSTSVPLPTGTNTPFPTPTSTPVSTNTPLPTDTPTLVPTNTPTFVPTNTPLPTNTPTIQPPYPPPPTATLEPPYPPPGPTVPWWCAMYAYFGIPLPPECVP